MTKIEIINETANFYNMENRGVEEGNSTGQTCLYLSKEGNRCAVGRCIKDELVEEFQQKVDRISVLSGTGVGELSQNGINLEDYLKDEYKGHALAFWKALQGFHDDEYYWNEQSFVSLTTPFQKRKEQKVAELIERLGEK